MMIVVPSFPERDQSDQKIVAAAIFCGESPPPENMRQRVNDKCSVIDEHRTDQEAPDQHLNGRGIQGGSDHLKHSSESQHENSQYDRRQRMEPVEKPEFGIGDE